ncbi:hypothetical protein [Abyssalbus ytuae]|uniref:Uncharacterized protein n=1 Tax=Abyssalbus ytuae TaxID=2926907 RepID=A0A9E7CUV5_9FLAO|nr:hypothetical protein [Abyssalbus ytuae]UOB19017.1 hypothetical protein MQE35_06895 [Abyssalbus ytuae]
MKQSIFILFVVTSYHLALSQINSDDRVYEIQHLLKEGKYSFDVLCTSVPSKSEEKDNTIIYPYSKNIKVLNNSEYADPFTPTKNIPDIDVSPVSIAEYRIIHNDTLIELKPDEPGLPFITVNLNSNTIKLEGKILRFANTIDVNNTDNSFQSKWKGYKWKNNTAIECKFIVGKIESSGKIYLEIKGYYDEYPIEGFFHYRLLS